MLLRPPVCPYFGRRALRDYEARVAEEGEVGDEELPEEVMDQVAGAAGDERDCFAVSCGLDAAHSPCMAL